MTHNARLREQEKMHNIRFFLLIKIADASLIMKISELASDIQNISILSMYQNNVGDHGGKVEVHRD